MCDMAPALPPVLVVDDHDGLRSALCEALRGEGYDAIGAGDGPAALDELRRAEPAVAIVDVRMPGMDGFTLLERMRDEDIGCPVILISVVGDVASRRHAERLGAFAFKEKPFDLRDLLEDVRAATAG
jgi:DNA-binding NtrC family response regulator